MLALENHAGLLSQAIGLTDAAKGVRVLLEFDLSAPFLQAWHARRFTGETATRVATVRVSLLTEIFASLRAHFDLLFFLYLVNF